MSKLILRVECQEIKFKFALQDANITFNELKPQILQKLNQQSQQIFDQNQIDLADESNFKFGSSDIVSDLLQQNDIIRVVVNNNLSSISLSQSVSVIQNDQFLVSDDIQQQQRNLLQSLGEEHKSDISQAKMQSQQQVQGGYQQIFDQLQDQQQNDNSPKEAIAVIFDISGSMTTTFYKDESDGIEISRFGAVNAFLSAFADKTLAFELNHIIQLYCFNSTVEKKCEFNNNFDQFIKLVDSAQPKGSTKLYDALAVAITSLLQIKQKYPNIILRIIALTDGEDNKSVADPQYIVKQIIQNKIIVDSFVVSSNCFGLKTITQASGGRCYFPQDLNQGLKLFEIETILSVELRDINIQNLDPNIDLNTLKDKPFDTDGLQRIQPKIAQKPVERPEVIVQQMQQKYQQSQQQQKDSTSSTSFQSGGMMRANIKRIIKEMEDFLKDPIELIKIFPSADDITFWKVLMIGPRQTDYNYGVFVLYVNFPQDYPFKPPKVRFITRVYHCNISQQGSLCLDILKDCWSPALTISKVCLSILSLLECPNPDDSLDSTIASEMKLNPEIYRQKLRNNTLSYASGSIDEIMVEIMGQQAAKESVSYIEKKQEIEQWLLKFKKQL